MIKKLLLALIVCIIGIYNTGNAKEIHVFDTRDSKIYIEDTSINYIGMNENYKIIDADVISKKNNGIELKANMRYYFNVNYNEIKYCYTGIYQNDDNGITWYNINYKLGKDINTIHTAILDNNIYSINNVYISSIIYSLI